jgi:hypothetical protein
MAASSHSGEKDKVEAVGRDTDDSAPRPTGSVHAGHGAGVKISQSGWETLPPPVWPDGQMFMVTYTDS